jgi:hypothetical protein
LVVSCLAQNPHLKYVIIRSVDLVESTNNGPH